MPPLRADEAGWRIFPAPGVDAAALEALLPDRLDALLAAASPLVPPGRHRLDRVTLPLGRDVDAVVKTYGHQAAWRDRIARQKGTKAFRAFTVACHLAARGVGTPEPIAALECWQGGRLVRSHFISAYIGGLTDFRAELNRHFFKPVPLCSDIMALLQQVADGVRALHGAGVLHNDLGNQNIALQPQAEPGAFRVLFMDLNRARIIENPTPAARGRDLARLDIPSDLRRVFFAMLHEGWNPPQAFREAERRARARFDRHTALRPFRHPVREARIRKREATMPKPPCGRELWIWDDRSVQPIPAYTSRDRHKYLPAYNVVSAAAAVLRHGPAIHRAMTSLGAPSEPVAYAGRIGLTLEADATWLQQLEWLARLEGPKRIPIQLRVYHHAGYAGWLDVLQKARALHEAGHPVSLSLVQSRRAVSQPATWHQMVAIVFSQSYDFVDTYHIAHAMNRSKWGVWDYREIAGLFGPVRDAYNKYPGIKICAPGCIDFEPHALAAVMANLPQGLHFHALSHALYVDRRGAPENKQGGFDTVRKCALLRAAAKRHPAFDERVIITEVNWPLLGTGVYSPVTSPYETKDPRKNDPSVTEDQYADYMTRYIRMVLDSGHVERIYWWRLAAHGFGLVDSPPDGAPWCARPAFTAFQNLLQS